MSEKTQTTDSLATSAWDVAFWRAYFEILQERAPLVDHWRDGSITWHPRVVRKLLWYSDIPDTPSNRLVAHDWLMQNAASPVQKRSRPSPTKR